MNKKNFILSLTTELMRQKTLPENQREIKSALALIKRTIKKNLGSLVEIKKFNKKGSSSLFVKNKSIKSTKILLNGHIDVVPAKDSLFNPKVKKDLILGRGALDMKGPLVAMIFSFLQVLQKNKQIPLGLLITSDEEKGGSNGAGWLASNFKKCQLVIIPDANVNFHIVNLQKAPFHLKIVSSGQSCHASRPWEGKNAVENLLSCLQQIKSLSSNDIEEDTITITQIKGGETINKIPDCASAILDIRLVESPKKSRLIQKIKKICHDKNCHLKALDRGFLFSIDKKNKFLNLWKSTAEEKLKRKLKFVKECGASDARFFGNRKIPVIITSPSGFGQHSNKEGVSLKSLCTLSDITTDFILKLDKSKIFH